MTRRQRVMIDSDFRPRLGPECVALTGRIEHKKVVHPVQYKSLCCLSMMSESGRLSDPEGRGYVSVPDPRSDPLDAALSAGHDSWSARDRLAPVRRVVPRARPEGGPRVRPRAHRGHREGGGDPRRGG